MDKTKTYQILIAGIMIIALVVGRPVSYPDNVHTLHGFPLAWGTHQLVTIAGPVDTWYVSITNLIIDLVFWVGLILIIPYLMGYLKK